MKVYKTHQILYRLARGVELCMAARLIHYAKQKGHNNAALAYLTLAVCSSYVGALYWLQQPRYEVLCLHEKIKGYHSLNCLLSVTSRAASSDQLNISVDHKFLYLHVNVLEVLS